jgi:hypothetical protein
VIVVMGGRGSGTCSGLKEMWFDHLLLIADAFVQVVFIAMLWTFSMREVAYGALQLSAWLDVSLLRHHCRMKDWRYSQAAGQVCYLSFMVDCVA